MQQRRFSTVSKLTLCALVFGGLACGGEDGPSDELSGSSQNLAPSCGAETDQPLTLVPQQIQIWPPNHKLHTIQVEDCVQIEHACDPDIRGEFVWASSDEPVDAQGDGHHAPDIVIDSCHQVQVRAERQGPKDGRVYKLGVRVVDRDGNVAESACTIVIAHDRSGAEAVDSGEQYRITLDGQDALPVCDGTQPPLPEDAGAAPEADAGIDGPTTDAGTPPGDQTPPQEPVTPPETAPTPPDEPVSVI